MPVENQDTTAASTPDSQLERSTYEIIRQRLESQAAELRNRLDQLNSARRGVFGAIETKLLATERITTTNNCVPSDVVAIGQRFIFGYNVHLGLRTETQLSDVFSVQRVESETFHEDSLELINSDLFENDFKQLYKYYKGTTFHRFFSRGPHLYMVFRVGKSVTDIKAFKWLVEGETLRYLDSRSDHEVKFPSQHEFEWTRTHRDLHRQGQHPHISIEDRLFVETVGGDLTIKIEDNTDDGVGIYSEAVDDADQVLDDADIFYSIVGNLILLKIRPYQENEYRYLVFNEKLQSVMRLDAIQHSCVLLPEGHGLIFSNGYYLQTGEHKIYEHGLSNLVFERRISSTNGEDDLFVFFNREQGIYVLLSYNIIEQRVEPPIVCHGHSFFPNGHLAFFKAGTDPQKHHPLQIWQTPYVIDESSPIEQTDSFLYKVGNKDIVRGMAECHEILNLIAKDESYANLYVDLVKKSSDVIDSYFWLNSEDTFQLDEVLQQIKETSSAAVSEFDKVVRIRRETKQAHDDVAKRCEQVASNIRTTRFDHISAFVGALGDLRKLRGEIVSLRDLRYVDTASVSRLEDQVAEKTERISQDCVEFLLQESSLKPYEVRVQEQQDRIPAIEKVSVARELDEEISAGATELEMLIDVVSNLKIDDATRRTQIIDGISTIYANLNQAKAALKKRRQELMAVEGAAEFHSQLKLLSQAVVNYLDICDSAEKCDEFLTKVMVQVEELEGRFAEFDDFVIQLSEKREEIYSAFDGRKVALIEARNKRASALQTAADRILSGIETRVRNIDSVNEINSYFAADLMIEKVRDIVTQLTDLQDSVKVDDIQSRLKTIREDAVRQLKDRQELFVDGKNVIRLGNHQFSVNTQELDLTTVAKDGQINFHLTGTNFMEPISDERLADSESLWEREVVSENRDVYRGEYLAHRFFKHLENESPTAIEETAHADEATLVDQIQRFMAPRYAEGYIKGVHDRDAAKIVQGLLQIRAAVGLLRYDSQARALAGVFWHQIRDTDAGVKFETQLKSAGTMARLFPASSHGYACGGEVEKAIDEFNQTHGLFDVKFAEPAAAYLCEEVATHEHEHFVASHHAIEACRAFHDYLERRHQLQPLAESTSKLSGDTGGVYRLLRHWVAAFVGEEHRDDAVCLDEAASILFDDSFKHRICLQGETSRVIEGLVGSHPVTDGKTYMLDYLQFFRRLEEFDRVAVPRYNDFIIAKKEVVEEKRRDLRLTEFKPRVLTSFVRNKLLDEVYLPLIGDNLAKQMGVVGEQKRTDLMGLLLLISPPGYGKTTLMEYVANRLGLTFVKINGPAIGHHVTSLDPSEAPHASAREEVEKLNLSLEMGDNVMIYVDDIQHCNPEFLQKFISLCDAQRKIEGVYQGRTRTYDLRGRKVAVVMAGNPYTESGDKFQIPDMLANRADTYNLGDVIGSSRASFELSYLENALTSNPTLNHLASRSTKDAHAIIKMAQIDSAEGIELEGEYSVEELNELVAVMKKLMRARDVVLKVNEQYIASAAQADAYRTEPPFKLQGSYRDMNKLAERVVPIMNDEELKTLIDSHYQNSAQTLTADAEANLLKLREMLGQLDESSTARWEEMKRTFKRNVLLGSAGEDDQLGRVIGQLTAFSEGLHNIHQTLTAGVEHLSASPHADVPVSQSLNIEGMDEAMSKISQLGDSLLLIKDSFEGGVKKLASANRKSAPATGAGRQEIKVINRVPFAFLEVIRAQFGLIQQWLQPLSELPSANNSELSRLTKALDEAFKRYESLINKTESGTATEKQQRESQSGSESGSESGSQPGSQPGS